MRPPAPAPARGPAVLPGALSPLTADLVRGPRRTAVVLAAASAGTYLGVAGRVLPVLAADAHVLPGALRLAVPARELSFGVAPGDVVLVGAGAVRLPGLLVRGVRSWRPARVRPAPAPSAPPGRAPRPAAAAVGAPTVGAPTVGAVLAGALRDSPDWLLDGVARAVAGAGREDAAVAALVGRGRGLTPSGDDALAGALLVRRAVRTAPRSADPLVRAVRSRLGSTTAVSAALLDAAADGWATREVVDLVDAAVAADAEATGRLLPPVLAVGHTSGRDLVAGVAAALQALARSGRSAA